MIINKRWFYCLIVPAGPLFWFYFTGIFNVKEVFEVQGPSDNTFVQKLLWPEDEECKSFGIQYRRYFKPQFLASFPRSGNYWTRYLIRASTGMNTESFVEGLPPFMKLEQRKLMMSQMKFHGVDGKIKKDFDGSAVIIKTHTFFPKANIEMGSNLNTVFYPVILLIRRPERSILSYWSFSNAPSGSELKYEVPKYTLNTTGFHTFFKANLKLWESENELFLKHSEKLLVIFYENLVKNPIKELQKMLKFLGYQTDPQRFKCFQKHLDGPLKRNHTYQAYPYTSEEEELFSSAKANIRDLVINRGFDVPDEFLMNENSNSTMSISHDSKNVQTK